MFSQSFNYTPYLFYKKRFKSEINSFCIWTQSQDYLQKSQTRPGKSKLYKSEWAARLWSMAAAA
jgi:hypothetical protein